MPWSNRRSVGSINKQYGVTVCFVYKYFMLRTIKFLFLRGCLAHRARRSGCSRSVPIAARQHLRLGPYTWHPCHWHRHTAFYHEVVSLHIGRESPSSFLLEYYAFDDILLLGEVLGLFLLAHFSLPLLLRFSCNDNSPNFCLRAIISFASVIAWWRDSRH
jgi:hypothetical protein